MLTPEQQIKRLKKKLEESKQECSKRGIELARLGVLVDKAPMPESTRTLLQKPLKSFIDRCSQGKKKE